MNASSQVEFSVNYRLREYLVFVTEHSFDTEDALRNLRGIKRRLAELAQKSVATLGFFYKMSRVGRCDFVVSSAGVTRHSKNGVGSVSWTKVKAVHTYSPGYLIELQSGAMPIPFRVMSDPQRELFCALAGDLMVNGAQPSKPMPLRGTT